MSEGVFLCCALVVLGIILVLICLHLYQIFEEPGIQQRMRQLRRPVQPWVTVLVYARHNEATIEASLQALMRSHYHSYDIVVVDDGLSDLSRARVKHFIDTHSKVTCQYVRRRVRQSSEAALKAGYRKSKKGKIVISLKADTIIAPSFLKRAVAVKQQRSHCTVRVAEPVRIGSLSEIIKALRNLVWHYSYKVEVSDAKNIIPIKSSTRIDFLGAALLMVVIAASTALHETIIYWYSWLLVMAYVTAVIWLHEEKVKTKLALSFSAVSALFLLPVASIVMAFSQFDSRN